MLHTLKDAVRGTALGRMVRQYRLRCGRRHMVPVVPDWGQPFAALRTKWSEVPTTRGGRRRTEEILTLDDDALRQEWEASRRDITTGAEFAHRGWYHALYADGMRGKKVLDVGCGFAVDSLTFAQHGAHVTFVDLAETNLQVVQRLCDILSITDARFLHLTDVARSRRWTVTSTSSWRWDLCTTRRPL